MSSNRRKSGNRHSESPASMGTSKMPYATFPAAVPHRKEDFFLSVICGTRYLHWAMHDGFQSGCKPSVFWKTELSHLAELRKDYSSPCHALSNHIPGELRPDFFGGTPDQPGLASLQSSLDCSLMRAVPILSVYVICLVPKSQEDELKYLFSEYPARLYQLQSTDFLATEGSQKSSGSSAGDANKLEVQLRASLKAAAVMFGHPALVMDGGSYNAVSVYAASMPNGEYIGGGVSPTLASMCHALATSTGNLPFVQASDFQKRFPQLLAELTSKQVLHAAAAAAEDGDNAGATKAPPISLANAKSTEEAIMANAILELASKVRSIVGHWVKRVGRAEPDPDEGADSKMSFDEAEGDGKPSSSKDKRNYLRHVVVTGFDGDMIVRLLQPDFGGMLDVSEPTPSADTEPPPVCDRDFRVHTERHLLTKAIGLELYERQLQQKIVEERSQIEQVRMEMVGNRVAMEFDKPQPPDDDKWYRGFVVQVQRGEQAEETLDDDLYFIRFDDNDSLEMAPEDLYQALLRYAELGERSIPTDEKTRLQRTEKCQESIRAAEVLKTHSLSVQRFAEKVIEEGKRKAKAEQRRKEKKQSEVIAAAAAATTPAPAVAPDAAATTTPAETTTATATATATPAAETATATTPAAETATATTPAAKATTATPAAKAAKTAKTTTAVETTATTTTTTAAAKAASPPPAARRSTESAPPPLSLPQSSQGSVSSSSTKKRGAAAVAASGSSSEKAAAATTPKVARTSLSPEEYVGQRMAKRFEDGNVYFGTIKEYCPPDPDEADDQDLWLIHYDDDDQEHLELPALRKALKLYVAQQKHDPKTKGKGKK